MHGAIRRTNSCRIISFVSFRYWLIIVIETWYQFASICQLARTLNSDCNKYFIPLVELVNIKRLKWKFCWTFYGLFRIWNFGKTIDKRKVLLLSRKLYLSFIAYSIFNIHERIFYQNSLSWCKRKNVGNPLNFNLLST